MPSSNPCRPAIPADCTLWHDIQRNGCSSTADCRTDFQRRFCQDVARSPMEMVVLDQVK
jgi:hypothetical protein